MTHYMEACTDLNYKLLLIRAMKATKQWNIHSFIHSFIHLCWVGGVDRHTYIMFKMLKENNSLLSL